jgi:hypothetical protein
MAAARMGRRLGDRTSCTRSAEADRGRCAWTKVAHDRWTGSIVRLGYGWTDVRIAHEVGAQNRCDRVSSGK